MNTKITIKGRVSWKYARNKKTGNWIAVSPELKLAVEGNSFGDLTDAISETINHVFSDLLSTGRLEKFLRSHNWSRVNEIPRGRRARFDIPFDTERVSERDLQTSLC